MGRIETRSTDTLHAFLKESCVFVFCVLSFVFLCAWVLGVCEYRRHRGDEGMKGDGTELLPMRAYIYLGSTHAPDTTKVTNGLVEKSYCGGTAVALP